MTDAASQIAPDKRPLNSLSVVGGGTTRRALKTYVGGGQLRVVLQQTTSAIMRAQSLLIKGHVVSHEGQIG